MYLALKNKFHPQDMCLLTPNIWTNLF